MSFKILNGVWDIYINENSNTLLTKQKQQFPTRTHKILQKKTSRKQRIQVKLKMNSKNIDKKKKILILGELCDDENLDKDQFKALIDAYTFSGQESIRYEVYKCLDNRPSILQARTIGERIIARMKEFVEVFVRGVG